MQGQSLFPSKDNAMFQFEGKKIKLLHLIHNSLLMPTSKLLISQKSLESVLSYTYSHTGNNISIVSIRRESTEVISRLLMNSHWDLPSHSLQRVLVLPQDYHHFLLLLGLFQVCACPCCTSHSTAFVASTYLWYSVQESH